LKPGGREASDLGAAVTDSETSSPIFFFFVIVLPLKAMLTRFLGASEEAAAPSAILLF
jgi:hypothetical protein